MYSVDVRKKGGGGANILLYTIKHTLHIQVHDFAKRVFRVCIELLSPGGTRIGHEDIDMVCGLAHFVDEPVELVHASVISRHGDCARIRTFVREGVECTHGFIAGCCFA